MQVVVLRAEQPQCAGLLRYRLLALTAAYPSSDHENHLRQAAMHSHAHLTSRFIPLHASCAAAAPSAAAAAAAAAVAAAAAAPTCHAATAPADLLAAPLPLRPAPPSRPAQHRAPSSYHTSPRVPPNPTFPPGQGNQARRDPRRDPRRDLLPGGPRRRRSRPGRRTRATP
jgi:hypothetical protein